MKNLDLNFVTITLLNFTKNEVQSFLSRNPDLIFSAFAYDCNAEYGEVNLCFLTEDEFNDGGEETLAELGDWEYQGIATIRLINHDERKAILASMPDDNFESWRKWVDELMDHFTKTLITFSTTKEFEQIPKSSAFRFLCMDHNENLVDANNRMNKLNS